MSYSRSPPRSPSSPEDWLNRGPLSHKTYSTSSSRHASRSQSLASASSRAYSSSNYENTARVYWLELKIYLKDLLAQGILSKYTYVILQGKLTFFLKKKQRL
jgi:hypothetical protein